MATCAYWKRYGHDRLYVSSDEGTRLGWLDLSEETEHVEVAERIEDFRAAVRSWERAGRPLEHAVPPDREGRGSAPPAVPRVVPHRRTRHLQPVPADRVDVGANRPDRAVTESTEAHRRARPAGTRVETLLGAHTETQVGATGAVATGRALQALTQLSWWQRRRGEAAEWRILDSIDIAAAGTGVEHLLIGPAGIFTISSRNHPGKTVWVGERALTVDRVKKAYTRNARRDARRAERLLNSAWTGSPLTIWPIISIVGAVVSGKSVLDEVLISPVDTLAEKLGSYPRILSSAQIREIHQIAARPATWQPG